MVQLIITAIGHMFGLVIYCNEKGSGEAVVCCRASGLRWRSSTVWEGAPNNFGELHLPGQPTVTIMPAITHSTAIFVCVSCSEGNL